MAGTYTGFVQKVHALLLPQVMAHLGLLRDPTGGERDSSLSGSLEPLARCLQALHESPSPSPAHASVETGGSPLHGAFTAVLLELACSLEANKGKALNVRNRDRITSWPHAAFLMHTAGHEDSDREFSWNAKTLTRFLKYRTEFKPKQNKEVRQIVDLFKSLQTASVGYVRECHQHGADGHDAKEQQSAVMRHLMSTIDASLVRAMAGSEDEDAASAAACVWRWKDLSQCVFALQHLDSQDPTVQALLRTMHVLLTTTVATQAAVAEEGGEQVSEDTACSLPALAHCFFGLRGMDANTFEVQQLLSLFMHQLDQYLRTHPSKLSSAPLHKHQHSPERLLGMCLAGMLTLDINTSELSGEYLPICTRLIHHVLALQAPPSSSPAASPAGLSSQTAASACYYMQTLAFHQAGVEPFLSSLNTLLEATRDSPSCKLSNQEVAMTLLGLKNKFSPVHSPTLQQVLENMHALMLSSSRGTGPGTSLPVDKQQPWSAVEGLTVALGLYGLSGVNQEHHAEVTGKILKWFAVNLSIARMQIDTTTGEHTDLCEGLGPGYFGRHRQSGFTFPPSSKLQIRPHEVALASYGLRQCSAQSPEIRTLLSYLTQCIHNNMRYGSLTQQYKLKHQQVMIEISMLVYGLKLMDSSVREVRLFVDAISVWLDFLLREHKSGRTSGLRAEDEVDQYDTGLDGGTPLDTVWNSNQPTPAALMHTMQEGGPGFGVNVSDGAEAYDTSATNESLTAASAVRSSSLSMLDNQAICMCVSGLRHLHSDEAEVKRLLSSITSIMRATREAKAEAHCDHLVEDQLTLWEVAKIMGGMKCNTRHLF